MTDQPKTQDELKKLTKDQLEATAASLGITDQVVATGSRPGSDEKIVVKADLAKAIADHYAAAPESTPPASGKGKAAPTSGDPDADVRAADQQRTGVAGGDDVSQRAIDIPRRRPGTTEPDQPRAPKRAIYRDLGGTRRVVGSGQPIPAGWTGPIEDAPIEGRAANTETVRDSE